MMKPTAVALAASLLGLAAAAQAAERSGKEVYEAVCSQCHATGKDGAPRFDDRAAWRERSAKGLDKVTANAITGIRKMPAHGGQAALSDVEMSRAAGYMISGGAATDTDKAYASPKTRSGEEVVKARCRECHTDGKGGAPRLGNMADWKPRLQKGVPALVKSAQGGHNGMPARGGLADLSDPEVKAAVEYMVALTGGGKK
ncbi:MAG: cytochrome c5 family protein [Betaproteobacteria bacterium]|nr:cytochrome c5 family protein [Betaproteobacteria bacterium]